MGTTTTATTTTKTLQTQYTHNNNAIQVAFWFKVGVCLFTILKKINHIMYINIDKKSYEFLNDRVFQHRLIEAVLS